MNPIPEPAELFEAECNALGLYGLPEAMPLALSEQGPHDCGACDAGTSASSGARLDPDD